MPLSPRAVLSDVPVARLGGRPAAGAAFLTGLTFGLPAREDVVEPVLPSTEVVDFDLA